MNVGYASVVSHREFAAGYRFLELHLPAVAATVQPGQFVHVKIPSLDAAVLRRPFSVFEANEATFAILYKCVGKGTRAMVTICPGDKVSVIGPLGNAFPAVADAAQPVLVAGGYGVAPLFFYASRQTQKGVLFVGGRTADDLLCLDRFREIGWDVRIATEDGSAGDQGYVTGPLDDWLATDAGTQAPEFFVCGPDGLLKAIGDRAMATGWTAWLSLDKHMGCGVGACLACVQMIRDSEGNERRKRVCKDGPIFEAREIVWP